MAGNNLLPDIPQNPVPQGKTRIINTLVNVGGKFLQAPLDVDNEELKNACAVNKAQVLNKYSTAMITAMAAVNRAVTENKIEEGLVIFGSNALDAIHCSGLFAPKQPSDPGKAP